MTEFTPEEIKRRETQARREYPVMSAILDKMRAVSAKQLFATKLNAVEERERLYQLVQAIDTLERELYAAMGVGSDAMAEYAEKFQKAATGQ